MTLPNLLRYDPDRLVHFEHEGQVWFSDSYLMVPMRRWDDCLPNAIGKKEKEEDSEFEFFERPMDVYKDAKEWDSTSAVTLLKERVIPLSHQRMSLPMHMVLQERQTPLVTVVLQIGQVYVNRLYVDVAEYVANRSVTAFGARGATGCVSLYSGEEFVGVLMPVRIIGPSDYLIHIGTESNGKPS